MASGEIAENVVAAVGGAVEFVPKMWLGVRSCHLKFWESLALPIYQTLPDMKVKIKGAKRSEEGIREEESKKDEKLDGEKGVLRKKGKGRIHEVRYMDGDELESEGDEEGIEEENEDNREVGSFEFGVRKRKEGDSVKDRRSQPLMGERSEEFGGKKVKRKSGVGKLKDKANKVVVVKDKKTKNLGLECGKEGDEEGIEEEIKDDGEVGSFEFGFRKREEGDSIDNLVPGDLNGGKRSKKSAAMGEKSEGSGGKIVKRKSGVGKLKDGQRRL